MFSTMIAIRRSTPYIIRERIYHMIGLSSLKDWENDSPRKESPNECHNRRLKRLIRVGTITIIKHWMLNIQRSNEMRIFKRKMPCITNNSRSFRKSELDQKSFNN